jgi:hypothetical protein
MEDGNDWATLKAEYRRQVFQVFNGDGWMRAYGHVYIVQPGIPGPTGELSLQDLIDELVDVAEDRNRIDTGDKAIWRDGCILAVVRKVPDGHPEVTRFVTNI